VRNVLAPPTGGPAATTADAPTPEAGYRIYVLGGNNGTDVADATVQIYDTTAAAWSLAPPMPTARLWLRS
jgi:Kelch motif